MNDMIQGFATNVIDGDTFEMKITHTGKNNVHDYMDNEKIRTASDAPELSTKEGQRAKERLKLKICGKEIRCYVRTRDSYGRLVAKLEIIRNLPK